MQHTTHAKSAEVTIFHRTPTIELNADALGQHANLKEAVKSVAREWRNGRGELKSKRRIKLNGNHEVFLVVVE